MDRSDRPAPVLYTVGHGNHPAERFVELIAGIGIELIVDVRSVPFSRFAPQFNRQTLEKGLAAVGVRYHYLGDLLGGWPGGRDAGTAVAGKREADGTFMQGLERLSALAASMRTAVMCAEMDPARCHRKHLIARAMVSEGWDVVHILADGTLVPEGGRDTAPRLF
jgi:uncharacterized protein (DUF488 family)